MPVLGDDDPATTEVVHLNVDHHIGDESQRDLAEDLTLLVLL